MDDKQPIESLTDESAEAQPHTAEPGKVVSRWWGIASIAGFACSLVAWAALFFNEIVSIWMAVIALALSVMGVLAGRSFWRDLAITSILMSAVLLVVYAIFFFGLNILVNSL